MMDWPGLLFLISLVGFIGVAGLLDFLSGLTDFFVPDDYSLVMRAMALALLVLFLAGCQSWHGDAEVRLTNGSVYRCPEGLTFSNDIVVCHGAKDVSFRWTIVAGYTAR